MAAPLVVGRPARRRVLLPAEGRAAERALVLGARTTNGVVQNDFFCIGRTAKNPALAHRVPQLHARREERLRRTSSTSSATRRRRTNDRRRRADQERADPEEPRRAPSSAPSSSPLNQELLQLSVEGEQLWDEAWSKFKAGLIDGLALDLAAARASRRRLARRSSSWSRSTRSSRVAFGNQNTLSEPVPFWNPLDWNVGYMLETLREHLARRAVPHRLRAHVRVRRDRARALAPDRLPGRLLRGPPRGPLARARAPAPDPARSGSTT